ncbi:hypothetical protein UFOVP257_74 [uncultured Caudovirales phage]|uniref:Uncharacterized protein n=1 Tax=uncultured Caudovirales phage TaxID=2100421 RepID=A0A6J5LIU0_9CAUD|nr:hypothetical protein UFOVP257_74 [uncultured Caudovirales phage]
MKKVLLKYNNIEHLHPDYQHRVMDIGDFYQQLPFDTDFEVYYVTNLDYAFTNLDPSTDWVVVVSAGHCTQDRNIYDKLIIEALKENSPLIGHILNFKDQYPHLHPQIFAVNYQTWVQAGWPEWEYSGEPQTFIADAIHASEETFHDEYTPHRISGAGYVQEYSVSEMQVAADVIRDFIEMGLEIINIPEHIRKNKFYLYPDQQWESFNEFLHGKEYTGTVYEQKKYAELINHLETQVQKQYYVLNTEPLQRPVIDKKIDNYMGVAAGLKLVATMIKNGFDEHTVITHFDFSQHALQFQSYIHKFWDGDIDTYEQVCKRFDSSTFDSYICEPRGTYKENLDYLLNQIGCTSSEFKEHWKKYAEMKVAYRVINLYDRSDQFKIARTCNLFKTNYLWISNAFWMEYSLIKHGKQELKDLRENLILELQDTNATIILDVEDTWYQGLITIND